VTVNVSDEEARRSLGFCEPRAGRRPPIVDRWETMPAATRVKVERMLQASSPRSLVRWLDNVADLLERERPGQVGTTTLNLASLCLVRRDDLANIGIESGPCLQFLSVPRRRRSRQPRRAGGERFPALLSRRSNCSRGFYGDLSSTCRPIISGQEDTRATMIG
jgi:hypothetical protein